MNLTTEHTTTSVFGNLFRFRRLPRPTSVVIFATLMLFTTLSVESAHARETGDPLEGINRPIHEFNLVVDTLLFKPLAKAYVAITPRFVKRGVSNVLSNVNDVVVTLNDILQGDISQAGSDLGRFTINSTLGLGGLFDVADPVFGLEKHDEDFGQTLAHWGVERGPYIVLPLLGPSTLRGGAGLIVDTLAHPTIGSNRSELRDPSVSVSALDKRAQFLDFEELMIGDEYLFLREIYLQNLEYRESDGQLLIGFDEF